MYLDWMKPIYTSMLTNIRERITSNWSVIRIMAMLLGCFVLSQAIGTNSTMAMIFGAFILVQALTNTGCFSSKGCAVPENQNTVNSTADIANVEFVEIKDK